MIGPEALVARLALAVALGGIVGLERERVESAAGLRTHALVSLGAALLMVVSMFAFADAVHPPDVVLDPSRVAAQIVSGIGFLGAGVIIFRREIIRGLTTAASVWVVAAIGMAVGGGLWLAGVVATFLTLGILAVMKPIERRLIAARRPHAIRIEIDAERTTAKEIVGRLDELGLAATNVDVRFDESRSKARLDVTLRRTDARRLLTAVENLASESGVRAVRTTVGLSDDQFSVPRSPRSRDHR